MVAAVVGLVPLALLWGQDVIPPVRLIVWHAASLAWLVVILVAAWGQGRALAGLVLAGTGERPPIPLAVVATGLGMGLFALEAFGLGAAGWLTTPALTVLVVLVFLATLAVHRRRFGEVADQFLAVRQVPPGSGLPLALAGSAVFVSWPFVLVPTRAFDALSYHLEVPLRYLQAGRIVDIPENLYSYTPQLNHMLYGLAMGLGGYDLASLINHLYFALALCVLWLGFRDRFDPSGGAWAAALAALSPVMLMEVVNSGVDWSAAFYTLAAISFLVSGAGKPRLVILAGVLAGMAAGCRHQPLGYAIVIPAVAGLLAGFTGEGSIRARRWGLFLGTALLTASPWYIRNWVFTGDPLFPLLANLLGRTDAGTGFVSGVVGPKPLALLWKWAFLPFQMAFDPLSYSMTATIGIQYLVLLPLLPLAWKRSRAGHFLSWWLALSFLAWYLNFRTARYAMPVLMIAGLWLGSALAAALQKGPDTRGWKLSSALGAAMAAVLVVNLAVFVGLNDRVNRNVGAALGMRSAEGYLLDHYEIYPAIDHLNRMDPPPGKVLFVGEMRGFYSRFPREVPSHNAPNRLLEMVKAGVEPSRMAELLRGAGFTHILLNEAEYRRMAVKNRNALHWVLTGDQQRRLSGFLESQASTIYSGNGIRVFSITRPATGGPGHD